MKPAKELPPREVLQELFNYDPETGALTWKSAFYRRGGCTNAGSPIFRKNGKPGGLRVQLYESGGKRVGYFVHRIAFRLMGVEISTDTLVDHRDGNPFNNKWSNIRFANPQENSRNRGKSIGVKLGPHLPKGVTYCRARGQFYARIRTGPTGKNIFLGAFDSPSEAGAAYGRAAKELHGEFARF